ncbi:MAG: hypothetical protein GF307_08860 [candidate division Zixibacteria bacterium]|nr:hypothetical protein [candidate division Zixibacteria bacterium]
MNFRIYFIIALLQSIFLLSAQGLASEIPEVHSGIKFNENGKMVFTQKDGKNKPLIEWRYKYNIHQMRNNPIGTGNGVRFDFENPELNGKLYYGMIHETEEMRYPYTIYYKRYVPIEKGIANAKIKGVLEGKYDFFGWREKGYLRLGYRVIDETGNFIYDGKIILDGAGPFIVDTCIIEGPFVNMVTHNSAVISFETNYPVKASVYADGKRFEDLNPTAHHEIQLKSLGPNSRIKYEVVYDDYKETYDFDTAPMPGSRKPFTFSFASDGRGNAGGGERDIHGVNSYILKRIVALNESRNVSFYQFSGDLIDGYTVDTGEILLEYANWKRTIEPYAHYYPVIAGMGNHECLLHVFGKGREDGAIDKFPFPDSSSEAIFARMFVNPRNGPVSEDGSRYDPDDGSIDFPSYSENVFYYTYDNVAIIVLNSNYWFSPSITSGKNPEISGNIHGYLMDNQLDWLEHTLEKLERDDNIDHVFTTQHTPIFPNGGHVYDDMWYHGNNEMRPWVAGKPVKKGIIERRDEYLDLLMNKSSKVIAVLTGDEHNYSRLPITAETPIYPDNYGGKKLKKFRKIYHINNGAAGAPYYAQEDVPWSSHVEAFSSQNALIFFHVDGMDIEVEVINPDTMGEIDRFTLR